MRKRIVYPVALVLSFLLLPQTVCAVTELGGEESSYLFSYEGDVVAAPIAYVQTGSFSLREQSLSLNSPEDLSVGTDGTLYIADAKQSCLFVLNRDLTYRETWSVYGTGAEERSLNAPEGVFCDGERVYVANTGDRNVVIYTQDGHFLKTVEAPSQKELGSTVEYEPYRITADRGGRIYVISRNQTQGIVQLDKNGEFIGYLGATRVVPSAVELFYRTIATKEMKRQMVQFVPTEYNNLTADSRGFIYATIGAVDNSTIYSAVQSRSAAHIAIRKLNPLSNDILVSNGYFPPVGDVSFSLWKDENSGASSLTDVAVGENGVYSLLDSHRNKVFTYNGNGDLLYIFGGSGEETGKLLTPVSLVYDGRDVLVLDKGDESVKRFSPTAYVQKLLQATELYDEGEYEASAALWQEIKREYIGSDLAYLGLGKAALSEGRYRDAMTCFRYANNRTYYSKALKGHLSELAERYLVWILPCAVTAVVLLVWTVRKVQCRMKESRYAAVRGIAYGSYVMVHPFDGFWELKHSQKGTLLSSTVLLVSAFLVYGCKLYFTPYVLSNTAREQTNVLAESFSSVIVLLGAWVVSNWCFTTLFDGKGTMKDIYRYTCYCLTPFILLTPPLLLIGHVFTLDALSLYRAMETFLTVWTGFLLFVGTLTTHQYSPAKTVGVMLMTVVGMAVMAFLALLCGNLVVEIYDFLASAIKELSLRW